MAPRSIPRDTDEGVFRAMVERWRTMTVAERVAVVGQLNADVETMAIAGIVGAMPDLTDREVRHELARRRFGAALADEAYEPLPA